MPSYPYSNSYPTYNNPYDTSMPIFAFVNGIEQANIFQVPANRNAILMDNSKPLFYVKATNQMGQATIKVYEFKEVPVTQQQSPQYVTVQDLENFKQELLNAMKGGSVNESDIQQPSN